MLQPTTLSLSSLLSPARASGSPMTTTSDFALALADLAGGAAVGTPPADAVPNVIEIVPPRPGLAATGNSLPPDIAALVGDLPEGLIDAAMPTDPIMPSAMIPSLPTPTTARGLKADPAMPTVVAARILTRSTEVVAPILMDPTQRIVADPSPTPAPAPTLAPALTATVGGKPTPMRDAPTESGIEDPAATNATPAPQPAPAKGRARRTSGDLIAIANVPASTTPAPLVVDDDSSAFDNQPKASDESPRKRQPAEPTAPAEPAPMVTAAVTPTSVVMPLPVMQQADADEPMFLASEPMLAPRTDATAAVSTTPIVSAPESTAAAATPRIVSTPSVEPVTTTAVPIAARPPASPVMAEQSAVTTRPAPASSPGAPAAAALRARPVSPMPANANPQPAATSVADTVVAVSVPVSVDSDASTAPAVAQPVFQPQPPVATAVAPPATGAVSLASSRSPTTGGSPTVVLAPPAGARPAVRSTHSIAPTASSAISASGDLRVDEPAVLSPAPTAAPERAVQAPVSAPAATFAGAAPAAAVAPEVRAALAVTAPVSPTVRPAADIPATPRDVVTESLRPVAPANVTTVPLPAAAPTPLPSDVMPAAQAFAQAMFAAPQVSKDVEDVDSDALPVSLMGGAGPATATATPSVAVPATAGAHANTLDMSRGEWMMSMIDRIETLRDESGAIGETRLTLSPDALGTVDIAVRRDESGQYQVRISADTAQARTMLADAAPRLNDMAEARGLKLSHAGVETDTGTNPGFADSNRRDAQQAAPTPRRPASAATDSGATSDPANQDTRIA